ncbi:hypothetical protein [Aliivibrio kagoshimensis]|uniref:hypothetical protein n=1 Tax=Aliivibrio kagoshimensis TaxID=2910230 RepID=UPI003D13EA65
MFTRFITLGALLIFSHTTVAANCAESSPSFALSEMVEQHQLSSLRVIGHFSLHRDDPKFKVQQLSYDHTTSIDTISDALVLVMVARMEKGEDLYLLGCHEGEPKILLNMALNRRYENGGGFSTINSLYIYQNNQQRPYPQLRVSQTTLPEKPTPSPFGRSEPFRPGPPIDFVYYYDEKLAGYSRMKP